MKDENTEEPGEENKYEFRVISEHSSETFISGSLRELSMLVDLEKILCDGEEELKVTQIQVKKNEKTKLGDAEKYFLVDDCYNESDVLDYIKVFKYRTYINIDLFESKFNQKFNVGSSRISPGKDFTSNTKNFILRMLGDIEESKGLNTGNQEGNTKADPERVLSQSLDASSLIFYLITYHSKTRLLVASDYNYLNIFKKEDKHQKDLAVHYSLNTSHRIQVLRLKALVDVTCKTCRLNSVTKTCLDKNKNCSYYQIEVIKGKLYPIIKENLLYGEVEVTSEGHLEFFLGDCEEKIELVKKLFVLQLSYLEM
eukprot:CAMPEP_0170519578 /NCGR_PEP_ID=MMETSP0209-20121228/4944_1 /TAXON_ID=665100 ORGANISM="Litonotus pictus, Strain P1" /NCGR_SAMPLE_ID=MMETSP0209 /ASSEMBLY_ACC=CAM_ASM_000301 /LENGTH=311 /DNA_ID=CAMNT_0010805503 /DNA_START=661 /DNA_END=1593 /DNA_ORIENTATION=+